MIAPARIRLALLDADGHIIAGGVCRVHYASVAAVCDLWDEFVPRIHAAAIGRQKTS